MKKIIRLTEDDLRRIVKESVQRIITEMDEGKIVNNKPYFNNLEGTGKVSKGQSTWAYTNKDKDPLALKKHNERAKEFKIDNTDNFPYRAPRDPLAARERQLKSGDKYGPNTLKGKLLKKHNDEGFIEDLRGYF